MDCLMGEVRRSVPYCVMALVLLNLLADIRVAKGEYLHKNSTTDTSNDTTTPSPPALRRIHTTEENKEDGEVGCHCNLPRCVTTSYMCKSAMGACFTRNTPTPTRAYAQAHRMYQRRAPMHGCVELLPESLHKECMKKSGARTSSREGDHTETANSDPDHVPDPELSCCSQDMCNYHDTGVYIPVDITYDSQTDMNRKDTEMVETLWFRAATIAVPIAGGFILIVLVLLASRMLSKENKRHRMAQVIGERYLKAPLYPGGSSEPLPHLPLYYHAPLSKAPSLAQSSHRASYEEKPCNYRPPDIQICSLEEIKPLNILNQDIHWDQRDTDSPLPS
ncbi:uncharacterized protein LOC135212583 [Macrobrachium nipponense]|uniref:uncharacterized protein LOC135212583 n=1 Tax=Macrobrachium nipponense TaxID=159736 RepID=UPI0030C81B0B